VSCTLATNKKYVVNLNITLRLCILVHEGSFLSFFFQKGRLESVQFKTTINKFTRVKLTSFTTDLVVNIFIL